MSAKGPMSGRKGPRSKLRPTEPSVLTVRPLDRTTRGVRFEAAQRVDRRISALWAGREAKEDRGAKGGQGVVGGTVPLLLRDLQHRCVITPAGPADSQ